MYRGIAKRPFHGANAGAAEKPNDTAIAVVLLLTKQIKPLINKRRDTKLLRPYFSMSSIQVVLRSGYGEDHQQVPIPYRAAS